ncbi:hypothetical protein BDP27DRAFT_1429615 [Rhodocollybia butyracea]|uniref:Uncharacterized protein n=1 Tax=Rhodocollybia butyracea TaxID=206335 RepID=A0A9P5PCC3_9AGAR|nr:hypothetical protein BDP27DRAFT_1429615 [Rhodocollybia butyracea]
MTGELSLPNHEFKTPPVNPSKSKPQGELKMDTTASEAPVKPRILGSGKAIWIKSDEDEDKEDQLATQLEHLSVETKTKNLSRPLPKGKKHSDEQPNSSTHWYETRTPSSKATPTPPKYSSPAPSLSPSGLPEYSTTPPRQPPPIHQQRITCPVVPQAICQAMCHQHKVVQFRPHLHHRHHLPLLVEADKARSMPTLYTQDVPHISTLTVKGMTQSWFSKGSTPWRRQKKLGSLQVALGSLPRYSMGLAAHIGVSLRALNPNGSRIL